MRLLVTCLILGSLIDPAHCIRLNIDGYHERNELVELGNSEPSVCAIICEAGVFTGVLIEKNLVLTVAQPFADHLDLSKKGSEIFSLREGKGASGIVIFADHQYEETTEQILHLLTQDPDFHDICLWLDKEKITAHTFTALTLHHAYNPETNEGNLAILRLDQPEESVKSMSVDMDNLSLVINHNQGLHNIKAVGYGFFNTYHTQLQKYGAIIGYSPYISGSQNPWLFHFSPTEPETFSNSLFSKKLTSKQYDQTIEHTTFPKHNFGRFMPGDQGSPLFYNGKLCGLFSHNELPIKRTTSFEGSTRFPSTVNNFVGKSTPLWTKGTRSALHLMRAMLHR